jgi:hypothetical protein
MLIRVLKRWILGTSRIASHGAPLKRVDFSGG